MALEIQQLIQGATRALIEADLVDGEPGYNADVNLLELIYKDKIAVDTFIHWPSEEKLATFDKVTKSGAQYIGVDGTAFTVLTGDADLQTVLENIDAQLDSLTGGGSGFIREDGTLPMKASWSMGSVGSIEVLFNNAITAGTNWNFDGDFSLGTNDILYQASGIAPSPNQVIQLASNFLNPSEFVNDTWYQFTYDTASKFLDPYLKTGTTVSSFTQETFLLPMNTGTNIMYFKTDFVDPGGADFGVVHNDSHKDAEITLDNLFVKKVTQGDIKLIGDFESWGENYLRHITTNKLEVKSLGADEGVFTADQEIRKITLWENWTRQFDVDPPMVTTGKQHLEPVIGAAILANPHVEELVAVAIDTICYIEVLVLFIVSNAANEAAVFKVGGTFRNDGGTTAILGQTKLIEHETNAAYNVTFSLSENVISAVLTGADNSNPHTFIMYPVITCMTMPGTTPV